VWCPAGTGSHGIALLPLVLPRVVASARELADVVVVDCPPMLAGTEAMDAMANADAALVVCRSGRTSRDDAERAQELLARVRVPVFGVALLGIRSGTTVPFVGAARRLLSRRETALASNLRPGTPPDRVGADEVRTASLLASPDTQSRESLPSSPPARQVAAVPSVATPLGDIRPGMPSRPASADSNLRKQAQQKRRTPSSSANGQPVPRRSDRQREDQ
jgi:cellulose biosynthesis protein BcsQ